jgi:hypothetical protein
MRVTYCYILVHTILRIIYYYILVHTSMNSIFWYIPVHTSMNRSVPKRLFSSRWSGFQTNTSELGSCHAWAAVLILAWAAHPCIRVVARDTRSRLGGGARAGRWRRETTDGGMAMAAAAAALRQRRQPKSPADVRLAV